MDWTNKDVRVTGGTGSFGKKLIDILLKEYAPANVIVHSRDGLKQHEMRSSGFDHSNLRRDGSTNDLWLSIEQIQNIVAPIEAAYEQGRLD